MALQSVARAASLGQLARCRAMAAVAVTNILITILN